MHRLTILARHRPKDRGQVTRPFLACVYLYFYPTGSVYSGKSPIQVKCQFDESNTGEIPISREWYDESGWCEGSRQDDTGGQGVGQGIARDVTDSIYRCAWWRHAGVLAKALFVTAVNALFQRTHVWHVATKPFRYLHRKS